MHQGHGQPASAVPPCRRVLADVGPARVDAETFNLARRPVRYAAPAPHQDRRPRRRDEDDDPSALADLLPRAGYSALRSRTHTAPRHLTGGARAPRIFTSVPSTRKPSPPQTLAPSRSRGGASTPRGNPKKSPKTRHPRRRNPQSAALSGLGGGPEHATETGLAGADRAAVGARSRRYGDHSGDWQDQANRLSLAGSLSDARGNTVTRTSLPN